MSASIINNKDFIIVKGILVKYKSNFPFVEIPEGVTSIGKEAFAYKSIQTVEVPETVTKIDDNAFDHCEELHEITLPENISAIGQEAFSYCWSLKELKLPNSLQKIGRGAFANTRIEAISIPNGINVIEDRTFEYCNALKKVDFPDELKSIGWRAFYNCSNLTDISFSTKIDSIDGDAFQGCRVLTGTNGFVIIGDKLAHYNGNDRVVRIPKKVKHITSRVFERNNRLRKVILPAPLESIGTCAFANCENLRDINIPEGAIVEKNAFNECPRLADENGFIIINGVLFGYYDSDNIRTIDEKIMETYYQDAVNQYNNYDGSNREQLERAIDIFEKIEGYKDSEAILRKYYKEYWELDI